MICYQGIEVQADFPEGTDSSHPFSFKDKNGDPITTAERIEFKLSDAVNIIIDWTDHTPLTAPGEIDINGSDNIVQTPSLRIRYLTIRVTHNNGKKITNTIAYRLVDSPNITP